VTSRATQISIGVVAAVLTSCIAYGHAASTAETVLLKGEGIVFRMEETGGRYSFDAEGQSVVAADKVAGVLLAGSPVSFRPAGKCAAAECHLMGTSAIGGRMRLVVKLMPHCAELIAEPLHPNDELRFITAGAAPAYGLGDHAVETRFSTLPQKQYNTDVSGFADDEFLSGQGLVRLVSNFIIYPRQRFAEVLIDPTMKVVHTSASQIVQGVVHSSGPVHVYYFFGDPHLIYAQYLKVRNDEGYHVLIPKYQAFGVGWEAFGALGWNTNQKTVQDSVDHYIADGFPLRWVVIGSGFWPSAPEMHETTSFGLWDHEKYPDPTGLVRHFRDEHLDVMLGLRITFISTGPYSAEGVAKGYFLEKDGKPQEFRGGWPKLPYYLLDAHNLAALDWYMGLVKRWQDYGINGWKEDFYGYGGHGLRDDKVDPVNDRLMKQGQLVIERNGYLSSNGDLHRINDFNYDQDQDRGPVNSLALAYSGFPLVYPDIVGGTFGENHFSNQRSPRMETYMMRNAQWAALHSSMGMGEPPWSFSQQVAKVMLQAARLHAQMAPYIYTNALRFVQDGYPWTMTPLPIAFPGDQNVYDRENATDRRYEWMVGDALLATPLYGNDYATSSFRDIYLPAGEWMDFDSGKLYNGVQTLKQFDMPVDKTPLFVGGSGVTLEDHDGQLLVCVYPVATRASVKITLPEGGDPVHIDVNGLPAGTPWANVSVLDGEGHRIEARKSRHAFTFSPRPGKSYRIRALQ
jgi:hypothetical protein